jgi:hypothetical protein
MAQKITLRYPFHPGPLHRSSKCHSVLIIIRSRKYPGVADIRVNFALYNCIFTTSGTLAGAMPYFLYTHINITKMKKPILMMAFLCLCLICKAQLKDTSSYWNYSDKVNEMMGDTSYYAETSDNSNNVQATIMIRYSKGNNEVLLMVYNGTLNFQIASNGYITTKYVVMKCKFDTSEIITKRAAASSDGSFSTAFIRTPSNFIKRIKKSNVLFIEIEIYQKGTYTFKFKTQKLVWEH